MRKVLLALLAFIFVIVAPAYITKWARSDATWLRHEESDCRLSRVESAVKRCWLAEGRALPLPSGQWLPIASDCQTPTRIGALLIEQFDLEPSYLCDAYGAPMLLRGLGRRGPPTEGAGTTSRQLVECDEDCWSIGFEVAAPGKDGRVEEATETSGQSRSPAADIRVGLDEAGSYFSRQPSWPDSDLTFLWSTVKWYLVNRGALICVDCRTHGQLEKSRQQH